MCIVGSKSVYVPSKSKHNVEEEIQECTGNLFGLDNGNEHVGEGTSEGKEDPHVQAGRDSTRLHSLCPLCVPLKAQGEVPEQEGENPHQLHCS
jgi:hypothetical protein